jgi:hypothetical protein
MRQPAGPVDWQNAWATSVGKLDRKALRARFAKNA